MKTEKKTAKRISAKELAKELEIAHGANKHANEVNIKLCKEIESLREQVKKLLEPKEPVKLNPDELFLKIQYDKEQKGEPKNYWGRLVNAEINRNGSRIFQLMDNNGRCMTFNKEKCINKEEVSVAVEKLMALRNAIR